MASFLLFLAVLFGVLGCVVYLAGEMAGHGQAWASDVCWAAQELCDRPSIALWTAAGLAGLWLATRIASALRD